MQVSDDKERNRLAEVATRFIVAEIVHATDEIATADGYTKMESAVRRKMREIVRILTK